MSEGGDPVPNSLVNILDHLACAKGNNMVALAISFTPNIASLESKFEETSIDLFPARAKK